MNLTKLTSAQFKQIGSLLEKKEALQARVSEIDQQLSSFDGGEAASAPAVAAGRGKFKRTPAARARMAAAQTARWAKKAGSLGQPAEAAGLAVAGKQSGRAGAKGPKAGKAVRGKRGAVKEAIIEVVQAAGKAGISVKDVASKLGVKYGNVSVWFGSTGKKVREIKRVGRGTYAWVK